MITLGGLLLRRRHDCRAAKDPIRSALATLNIRGRRMKIDRLTIRELRLDLKYPFETSFARVTEQQFLLLEAEINGVSGHSECVADIAPGYSYETVRTAEHLIRDFLWPLAAGNDYAHPDEVVPSFARVRGHNMAKAAIEMAVWDAFARLEDKPLAGVLGGTRTRTVSGVSIGIQDTVEALLDKIGLELSRGYRRIKIKIKPGWDVDVVRTVRERYPDMPLMVDANSAYTLADEPLFRELDQFGLMMIEQPLEHDDMLGPRRAPAEDRDADLPGRIGAFRRRRPAGDRDGCVPDHQRQGGPGRGDSRRRATLRHWRRATEFRSGAAECWRAASVGPTTSTFPRFPASRCRETWPPPTATSPRKSSTLQ